MPKSDERTQRYGDNADKGEKQQREENDDVSGV